MATFVAKSNTHSSGDLGYGSRYLQLTVTQEKNIADNTSTLYWKFESLGGTDNYSVTVYKTTIKIGDQQVYYKGTTAYNSYVFPAKKGSTGGSVVVQHNDDGSLTVPITFITAVYDGYFSKDYGGDFVLDPIERASTIICADTDIGSAPVISINSATTHFTHTVRYEFESLSGVIVEKTDLTTIDSWIIPTAFYNEIPNDRSGTVKLHCDTYNGDVLLGTETCEFQAMVNEDLNAPTLNPTVEDLSEITGDLTGDTSILVRYHSYAYVEANAAARGGASLKRVEISNGSRIFEGSPASFEYVESSVFNITVVDSRGFITSKTIDLDAEGRFVNYVNLTCNQSESRPDASGQMDLACAGIYYNGSIGQTENTLTVRCRCRTQSGTYVIGWTDMTLSIGEDSYQASATLTGLDYKTTYVFEVEAWDELVAVLTESQAVRSLPTFDWGENDFAFHVPAFDEFGTNLSSGLAQRPDSVDANTTLESCVLTSRNTPTSDLYYVFTYFDSEKSKDANRLQKAVLASGSFASTYHRAKLDGAWSKWQNDALSAYPVDSIYINWSHISPAELFGGTWVRLINPETGEGVFLFGGAKTDTIGTFDGESRVTLSLNELPDHRHGFLDYWTTTSGNGSRCAVALNGDGAGLDTKANERSYTANAGGGESHNNMPPYVTVSIWRRTA